ncbi:MAG: hypothetical protein LBH00_01660 [Planctomycetaceae bacterium]|jgi:hypothetical protein|nr:hypothetical protein [Planctomycetaceae bacterium]
MLTKFFRSFSGVLPVAAVVLTVLLTMSSTVSAQLPPAISPWMRMFDRDQPTGGLGNYLGSVKPHMDSMRESAAQANRLKALQQATAAMAAGGGGTGMQNLIGDAGAQNLTGRAGAGLDPNRTLLQPPRETPSSSSAAYYNQHLHYYQSLPRRSVPMFSSGRR